MDVRSLYTNIPNAEGISAVRAFDNHSKKTAIAKVITMFLVLILIHYLQIKRCTMDTICAPVYANFELKNQYIKDKTKIFLRFIVDLFMI